MSQSTYSSARQGLIEDSMTYAEEDELLADVVDEIYETFIISAVLAGAISIPDFWGKKDDYFAHTFNKPPKGLDRPGEGGHGHQDGSSDRAKDLQADRSRKRL